MDVVGDDARRAGATDRGDIEDRAILDRLDLRRQLVLVAVLLEIAVELDGLDEAIALGIEIVDRDVLGPAEMGIDAFQILGSECDFYVVGPFS